MIWIPLLIVIVSVSLVDIRTRYVSPLLVVPLVGLVLGGWGIGFWEVSWLGGVLAFIGTMVVSLPLGDVFAFALCGLLVGPEIAMSALLTCLIGLLLILVTVGERISIVRHPFFPYLGTLVATFTLLFSPPDFHGIFTGIFS